MSRYMHLRRTWHGVLRSGSLLLLLAFLPTLLYVGHWGELLNPGQGRFIPPDHLAEHIKHGGHHAHCHIGVSTCSEQPVPLDQRVVASIVEVPDPEFPSVLLDESADAPEEFVLALPTEPPRL